MSIASAKRKILFVTGTRADFGKLKPLALGASAAGHEVSFFVTGMHVLPEYGLTKLEVHRLPGVQVTEFVNQRATDPQDITFAKTVTGFSDYLRIEPPDLVVIHGDRVEAMAAALVCATNYIRSAHIEGGEVSGTIDEAFRHCNTKLATAHLVSSENAAKRIHGMGESPESVFVIGSPELDLHNAESGVDIAEVRARYEIPFDEYGVAIFHSVTSEQDSIQAQARALFDTLKASGRAFVVIQPNNDPGSNLILDVIRTLPADRFRVLPSMRFTHFSELLKNAALIIGNSSVGVREAPFLGIPSIDIGTRQTNRSRAPSISSLDAHETQSLSHLINSHWGVRFAPDTGFGHGRSVDKFLGVIEGDSFWNLPLQKNFSE